MSERLQPRCQEDQAIDAITLECAQAVDDYVILEVTEPLTWYDATVECADDGADLIVGAGVGFNIENGVWDMYRCAITSEDAYTGMGVSLPISGPNPSQEATAIQVENPVVLPDTAMPSHDGFAFVLGFAVLAAAAWRGIARLTAAV